MPTAQGSPSPENSTAVASWKPSSVWLVALSATVAVYAAVLIVVPIHFYADDTYFYFQVARNFAHGMGSTFNGIMNTNGYHPLWMLVCAVIFKLGFTGYPALRAIAVVLTAISLGTFLIVRRLLLDVGISCWWIALLLLVPFSFTTQLGTEGSLSALLIAAALLFGYRMLQFPTATNALAFHTFAALAVLARLDNIFIIALIWLSTLLLAPRENHLVILRWHLRTIPVYLILWGGYLATNWFGFHTIQPISGMLKSASDLHHMPFANLDRLGEFAFAVSTICILFLALKNRTLFFRAIAVPMYAGVAIHGLYISLHMSSETRWSWYYTTWFVLAAILLAMSVQVLLDQSSRRAQFAQALAWITIALLLVIAALRDKPGPFTIRSEHPGFAAFTQEHGIDRALIYDKPGRLAYFSNVAMVPIDGLMGNLDFQKELATKGILEFAQRENIRYLIGPPLPTGADVPPDCTAIQLGSRQMVCTTDSSGHIHYTGITVFSRIPFGPSGTIPLPASNLIYSDAYISIWRI